MARNNVSAAQKRAFAEHIGSIMDRNKMTVADVSSRSFLSATVLNNYLAGRNFPERFNMTNLAHALGVTFESLNAFRTMPVPSTGQIARATRSINNVPLVHDTPLARSMRALMIQRGMTQSDVARVGGLSAKVVSEYMRGEVSLPGEENRRKLAAALQVTAEAIYEMAVPSSDTTQKTVDDDAKQAPVEPVVEASIKGALVVKTESLPPLNISIRRIGEIAEVTMRLTEREAWELAKSFSGTRHVNVHTI